MRKRLTNVLLILMLLVGISLLLYPSVSDYWNSKHQTQVITTYMDSISSMDKNRYASFWDEAKAYNRDILLRENPYRVSEEQKAQYDMLLNPSNNGIMGYIEIPIIKGRMPLYHGTEESVLQVGIGHLDWTSLPTGGESTHCVVSGHRGLPSAKLFTDLDQIVVGDIFYLHILDETLCYQVDQILVVEPDDTKALLVEEGKDYCTLVTCTPYGVNSHRMLVRGERVEDFKATVAVRVTADALQIEPLIVASVLSVPILALFLLLMLADDKYLRKRGLK